MSPLELKLEFNLKPIPPYNFELTVRNPAGWHLFTPFEQYGEGVLWSATHIEEILVGLKIRSSGTTDKPEIRVEIYTESGQDLPYENEEIRRIIGKALGTDQDLSGFYRVAAKDSILKHTVEHLYGMHDTFPLNIYPDAILAILLQMAPLKRSNDMMASLIENYGVVAEFDLHIIRTWPLPSTIAAVSPEELAEKCRVGYRAKNLVKLSKKLEEGDFPTTEQIMEMAPEVAKKKLMELPGIGDYSSDIMNPHGGFPIDVWSAEVFARLFFDEKPENNREAVERVKSEGLERWGEWAWMAFFYVVQDLPNLSDKLGKSLRLT